MKRIVHFLCLFVILASLLAACSKELSTEGPGFGGLATGSLLDSSSVCKSATIKGQYKELETLTDSNYVLVSVNFTTQGKYTIFTDTVNGMWFRDSGFAFVQGANTIKLKGKGSPILPGTFTFQVNFGNSTCFFDITTIGSVNNGSSSTDYLPITANGYINYELTPAFPAVGGSLIPEFRSTISSGLYPQIYQSATRNYTRYTTNIGDQVFLRKDGAGKYFQYGTPEFDYLYIYDTIVNNLKMDFTYLDESKNPGQFFDTDSLYVGANINGTLQYGWAKLRITTLYKGRQMSLLGTLYTDIITVKRELLLKLDGVTTYSPLNLQAELSYAKGIGLVDQRVYESTASGTTVQSITIKGWNGL
ncbi:hypothetical protein [Sediminibacterium sp.]|uniref:hypothetical protein n=1 Tax=Sediminibacterium sp. TaxID=1917865 RepID=UPI0025E0F0DE|nr:hypothetical protein [Sediminibacterium sp.]MDO8998061.1 hypothetical protein [Sediminibacterium sp.]MDP2422636.1 hypothetical protein [Sediminibacterium sp.]